MAVACGSSGAVPAAGSPGVPPLLDAVLRKMAADQDHWACTWSSVYTHAKGHPEGMTKFRSDPSQPYPEQWKPLLISGRPPSEKTMQDFQKRGEKHGEDLERRAPNEPAAPEAYQVHMVLDYNLAAQQAVAFYDEAAEVREDGEAVVFDVPLHSDNPVPLDVWSHFHLLVRVNRRLANLEHVSIVLRTPLWLVKVREFHIETDYRTIDPAFGAVPVSMNAVIDVSALFKGVYLKQDSTYTEYRRVTPFGDRFQVKIGPLRTLGF